VNTARPSRNSTATCGRRDQRKTAILVSFQAPSLTQWH